jgi:hypothetical protein
MVRVVVQLDGDYVVKIMQVIAPRFTMSMPA